MAITLQTTIYKVVYVYSRDAHPGLLKVGKTQAEAVHASDLPDGCEKLEQAVKDRLREAATMGVTDLHIHYATVAYFDGSDGMGHSFDDNAVHDVLVHSHYKRVPIGTVAGVGTEWFQIDLDTAIKAINAVKNEQEVIDGPAKEPDSLVPKEIRFREEQARAIEDTLTHFSNNGNKMLWNAKMRFGKTLCALELINRFESAHKVMILTHRPTVKSGWFEDYHLIKFDRPMQYGSKNGDKYATLDKDDIKGKDLATMQRDLVEKGTSYIYFASMQDLRGREVVEVDAIDDKKTKEWKENNRLVYATDWDLIIFDEAHEGTQTSLGKQVTADLTKNHNPYKLYLSGTPFNILSQFDKDEIYTWDYIMEQEAKENWSKYHPDEPNPYEGLAKLNIYTYNLGEVFDNNPDYGETDDEYFNFAEFFRTWTGEEKKDGKPMAGNASVGDFIHEDHVWKFLDLLCKEAPASQYPYSNDDFRNALSHTLWMLPGVASAARLEALINKHKLHTQFGFEVINVAGEGSAIESANPDDASKIEKKEKDALKRVKDAIKHNEKTITLSCGRLTTGVSVPEWTGVFMLSGGYSTGAANYMQTIFRGQTPYKNGAIKSNCYAFDFAPDRTLTVIDDYLAIQPGNKDPQQGTKRERSESFLKFCPVIALTGGQEVEYDTLKFVERVNQAYTDHIISHGFKSRHLFRNMSQFRQEDHDLLAKIGKLIGGGKVKTNSDGTIDIASNDLTDDKPGKNTSGQPKNNKKPKDAKPKTGNTTKHDEQTQRRKSQDVLDKIFIRFPLMLFGAVTEPNKLTIEDLLEAIDDESWEEFMPKGLTKPIFTQIQHLIEIDNLILSTEQIINEARKADDMPIKERIVEIARIVSKFHFTDSETVLTPWRVVNMHLSDAIGGYDFYDESHHQLLEEPRLVEQDGITTELFCNSDTKILEVNSKSGVYPLWLCHTLWRLQGHDGMTNQEEWQLWKKVIEDNLYIVCKTKMAEKITRRVLVGYGADIHPNTVFFENLIDNLKDEKKKAGIIKKICNPSTYNANNDNTMIEFDAVVGNPPYQMGINKEPVYHYFIDLGLSTSDLGTLIHPGRFLFNAGKTPKDWNNKMLSDEHYKVVSYWSKSDEVFKSVEIKGGVAVTMWNKNQQIGPIGTFVTYEELQHIHKKVQSFNEPSFSQLVYSRDLYQLTNKLYEDHPEFEGRQSKGHRLDLGTTVFSLFPEVFYDEKPAEDGYGLVVGREDDRRVAKWIKSDYLKLPDNFEKYKVVIAKSNGSGIFGEELSSPFIAEPFHAQNTTFLCIGNFDTPFEANACLKYIKTKFVRCLLGVYKVTQDNPRSAWRAVPIQNFTSSSDIDWSRSIQEIDEQLYKKYGLYDNNPEGLDLVSFINEKVKPME